MEGESYHEEGRRLEEEEVGGGGEEAEAEAAELELRRCGTVLEHVAFLFEPKLRTKMNQHPVRGGGLWWRAHR